MRVEVVNVSDVDRFLLLNGEEVECLRVHILPPKKWFKGEILREIRKLISGKSLRSSGERR